MTTGISNITVKWTPENNAQIIAAEIRSRVVGVSEWSEQAARADPNSGSFLFTANAPNSNVEVQLRYRMANGTLGEWADMSIHTDDVTIAYATIAGTPTSLAQISASEGSKLGGIAPGATLGAALGTNLTDASGLKVFDPREIVTLQGTSADTTAVNGVPAATVTTNIATNATNIGQVSAIVNNTTAPDVPKNLAFVSTLALDPNGLQITTLKGSWTASTAPLTAGYILSISTNGGAFVEYDVGLATVYQSTIPASTPISGKILAYDRNTNRSAYSSVVSYTAVRDTVAPAVVTNLTATSVGLSSISISWTNPADADLLTAIVYESFTANFIDATAVGTVNAKPGQVSSLTLTRTTGSSFYYWVVAVDSSGNQSASGTSAHGTVASVSNTNLTPGLIAPATVASLPSATGYTGPAIVFNQADGKLYRYTGGAFTSAVPGTDLTSGSVLSSALASSSLAAITGSQPIQNSAITVVGGTLSGIGTTGIAVDNSRLSMSATGVLSGGGISAQIDALQVLNAPLQAGATKNTVTSATTAPTSPTNGDIWNDTSTNPVAVKIRVAGVWVASANLVTNTSQVADGANLGGTAAWTGVVSRPSNLSALTGSETINNAAVSIASGTITGIGTGNGTAVANALVGLSAAGVLTGAGGGSITALPGASIVANSITAGQIAANTITGGLIAANTISASNIVANTITSSQIATGTITATQIAAGTITASNIGAGQITASKLNLTDLTNLIQNPQLSTGTLDGWTPVFGSPSVAGPSTAPWPCPYALLFGGHSVADQIVAGNFGFSSTDPQAGIPTKMGDQFYFTCTTYANSGAYPVVDLVVRRTSDGGLTGQVGGQLTGVNGGQFVTLSGTMTNNFGDGFLWLRIQNAGDLSQNVYVWQPVLRRKNNATLIVDGSITATQIAANTITANNIAAGTITAAQIATGSLTSDRLSVGVKGNNMLTNPGAEEATAGWQYVPGSGTCTFTSSTNQPKVSGSSSFALQKDATNSYCGMVSRVMPVTPGKTYVVRCQMQQGSANAGYYFRVYGSQAAGSGYILNPDGGVNFAVSATGGGNYENFALSGLNYQVVEGTWTCPAGIYWASVYILNYAGGSTTLLIDDIEFYAQSTTVSIADGTITANKIVVGSITADRIAAGTITGDRFNTGTSLPGSITVGSTGVTIGTAASAAVNASPFTWVQYQGVYVFSGMLITKAANTNWDTNAYSTTSYVGACQASFTLNTYDTMCGLIPNQDSTHNYGSLSYAWHRSSNGNWYVFESGTGIPVGQNWNSNTVFKIVYDGRSVSYYADTTLVRIVGAAPGQTFYLGADIYGPGSAIRVIDWGGGADNSLTNADPAARINAFTTTINGGQITTGTITAAQVAANSITADRLQIGSATGARTQITNNQVLVYDANNVLRVRMGVW